MQRDVEAVRYIQNIESRELIADTTGRCADAQEDEDEDERDAGQRKVEV